MPNLISVRQINSDELNKFCASTLSNLVSGMVVVIPETVPIFRLDIISQTGSGSNSISSISTSSLDLALSPSLYFFKTAVASGIQGWQLISGTHSHAPTSGYVRPNDFDVNLNPKVWFQVM